MKKVNKINANGTRCPRVSVLTPIYNTNPDHLRECIESIINQTFTDFEFLILNDSPDNKEIEKIVKSYADKDKRIKYCKNTKNIGISASRNKLLDMARGEYIAIFDHDDISMPKRLEKQVDYLSIHPEIGVVGCNTLWFPENKQHTYKSDNLEIKRKMLTECAIPHSGAMIRKCVLLDNNIRWESEYFPAEDYMLWVRLMNKTMFYNIQEVLLKYRFSHTNTTNTNWGQMCDKTMLIHSYTQRTFVSLLNSTEKESEKLYKKSWIYLFDLIPIIKVKKYPDSIKFYLFGLLPLFVTKVR